MNKIIQEFKDFAIKGNLIDMAVGIILGTAFNNLVNTLVKKVIMPPISLLTDGVNFVDRKFILRNASDTTSEVAMEYGEMIEAFIDFGIIAFTIFVMIKFIKRFKDKSEDPANKEAPTPKNIELLSNIEQLLTEQNRLLKEREG